MVTELAEAKNKYQSAFRALQQQNPTVKWVEILRESAMDRFELLGIPSVKEEEWKYTNLASLAKANFQPTSAQRPAAIENELANSLAGFSYPETRGTHLVLVNGVLRRELSSMTGLANIVSLDLSEAIADAT